MGPPLRCFLDNRIVAGGPFPRVPKVGLCQWWFNSGFSPECQLKGEMAFNHEQKCQLKGEMAELGPFSEAKCRPFRGRTGIYRSVSGNSAPRQRRGGNAGTATLGRQRQHVKRRLRRASCHTAKSAHAAQPERSALVKTQPARRATSAPSKSRPPGNTLGQAPVAENDPIPLPPGNRRGCRRRGHFPRRRGPGRSSSAKARRHGRWSRACGAPGWNRFPRRTPAPHRPRTR